MGFTYKLGRALFRVVMKTFFKEIEVVGIDNIPKDGPLIICGNHSNQFVDGMLIISHLPRELGFIMAAKSVRRPLVGFFAKKVNVIPVERPQDLAFQGKGTILALKNNVLLGKGTQFKKELKKGDVILLSSIKNREFAIKDIVSDEELVLVPNASNPTDVEKANCNFKIMPKIDQSSLFESVYEHLHQGKCIGIFPEGGSHDRTELIELKAGVSIMALGAMAKYGIRPKIVPIGLNYYQANEFRSKVIMDIGAPYEIPKELYDMYMSKNKKEAVAILLEEVENRMKSCLISAPSYSHLSAIFAIRRIYKPDNITLTGEQEFILNRRFALGVDFLQKHPEIETIIARVNKYNQKLKSLGIKDEDVVDLTRRYVWDLVSIMRTFSLFVLSAAFALPGIVMTGPLAYYCKRYGEIERQKALKGSSVKIEGFDVVASYKIICAFVLFPLASLGLTAGFYMWTKYMLFTPLYRKLLSCGFFVIWPVYISTMVRSVDEVYKQQSMLKAKFRALVSQSEFDAIKKERLDLKALMMKTVDEFGPKVFKNFPEGRVISREDIVKDVRGLMETDQVVDFIQKNKSTSASEQKKD